MKFYRLLQRWKTRHTIVDHAKDDLMEVLKYRRLPISGAHVWRILHKKYTGNQFVEAVAQLYADQEITYQERKKDVWFEVCEKDQRKEKAEKYAAV